MIVRSSASLKYVSIPPRKMRLVGDLVKGLPVEDALNILNFTPRIAARHVAKTLKSAAANALSLEGTDHLRPEALTVKNVIVDAAPAAKRIRYQSMGRVFRYKKRFCHLTVHLEGETDAPPVRTSSKAKSKSETGEDKPAKKTKTGHKVSTTKARAKKTTKKPAKKKTTADREKSAAKSKSK